MELMRAEKERAEEEHRERTQQREKERRAQEEEIAVQIAAEREQAALTAEEIRAKVKTKKNFKIFSKNFSLFVFTYFLCYRCKRRETDCLTIVIFFLKI